MFAPLLLLLLLLLLLVSIVRTETCGEPVRCAGTENGYGMLTCNSDGVYIDPCVHGGCNPGYIYVHNRCEACHPGTYKSRYGNEVCTPCTNAPTGDSVEYTRTGEHTDQCEYACKNGWTQFCVSTLQIVLFVCAIVGIIWGFMYYVLNVAKLTPLGSSREISTFIHNSKHGIVAKAVHRIENFAHNK